MPEWAYPIRLYDKQRLAVASKADEVLFGGSLAGGKTEMLLKHFVDISLLIPGAKTLILRKSYPQMVEIGQRLRTRIPKDVATYNKQDHVLYFKHNDAELHLGFLDSIDAAENYQGHEYVKVGFDELTHYDRKWVAEVQSRVRADKATEQIMHHHGLQLGMLAASNPGSRGHAWVHETYIKPAPPNTLFTGEDGVRRIFIPSSLYDNPYINHDDYIRRLGNLDPIRKRALIEGDWGIPSGVRFPQFREALHTITPGVITVDAAQHALAVGADYGFSDPTAAVWGARFGDTIYVYREFQETELPATEQATTIRDLETPEEVVGVRPPTIALDPAAWRRDVNVVGPKLGGHEAPEGSIAHSYRQVLGPRVVKAQNDRLSGWALIDELLAVPEGRKSPRLVISNHCRRLISALGSAPRDKRRPEDVDTTYPDDHVLDALRYLCQELIGQEAQTIPTAHDQYATDTADTDTGGFTPGKF